MKKYSREDQRLMASWSLDCAERVLGFFEIARPDDARPRAALEAGREWVRTGEFAMSVIRGASLSAHAAAKETGDDAAKAAAHAAGQAVATAHVPQHAYGGAFYALKAVAAAQPENSAERVTGERAWQADRLAAHLREEVMSRLVVEETKRGLRITINKDGDY